MDATTLAIDLAKFSFEVAIETRPGAVSHRRFRRTQFAKFLRTHPPAHVVMEACATAHYWGRVAQQCGHEVRLLPAQYVTPFVRRQKTDRTDAEGLLDAARSARLRAVAIKTVAQQEIASLHRVRHQWMTTRTARVNALRGLLAEFGVIVPSGVRRVRAAALALLDQPTEEVPARLRRVLVDVIDEIRDLEERAARCERDLQGIADAEPVIARLQTIPGIGLLTSTALVGAVGHIAAFTRGRRFASWLGLTPREHSSGQRRRLGAITKQGDVYLRSLLVHGARSALLAASRAEQGGRPLTPLQHWALALRRRRGANRATIALANKLARIVWAVWLRDVPYGAQPVAA